MRPVPRALSALVIALVADAAAAVEAPAASNCDALRAQIDARIRASGVASFSLAVVDAEARAEGKVVGTCERGTKKIVYARGDASGAAPAAPVAPAAPARREDAIVTECKDGSVVRGGDCPKK